MSGIDFDIFRKNLVLARKVKDFTAKQLAEKAGLKQLKRVSDIEEGRGAPDLNEIFMLCACLDQRMQDMLFNEGELYINFKAKK